MITLLLLLGDGERSMSVSSKKISKMRRKAKDAALVIFGSLLFSVSVNMFSVPNEFVQGGLTGISIMINSLLSFIPVGTSIFVLNIPLIIIAFIKLGKRFTLKTAAAILVSTAVIDVGSLFIPAYRGDDFLACIFCGIFSGLGLALVMLSGATTGGTEIIAVLVRLKKSDVPIGRMILFVDLIIISISYLVFRNTEAVMYAVVSLFVSTKVIDFILGGAGHNKMMFIVTDQPKKTAAAVMACINRGVTVLSAVGGFTGKEKSLVFCVARASEISRVNRILPGIDKNSFTVVGDVGEVLGNGF